MDKLLAIVTVYLNTEKAFDNNPELVWLLKPKWVVENEIGWALENHRNISMNKYPNQVFDYIPWTISKSRPLWVIENHRDFICSRFPEIVVEHAPEVMYDHSPAYMYYNHNDWFKINKPTHYRFMTERLSKNNSKIIKGIHYVNP